MAEPRPRPSFARRIAAARPREKKYSVWDDTISGLGVCIYPSGTRSFFLRRVLAAGRVRSVTLGSADRMSLPEARNEARLLLATLLDTPKKGRGPRYPGRPMAEFADEFVERHARHWKPSTLDANRRFVRDVILPAFGHMTVDAIAVEHVRDWFASMAHRPGTANRAMPVLSVMMRMAELWGYRLHNTNPCRNTRRYRMAPKERYLSPEEMARLNAVLTRDEFYCPHVVAVIRLLLLTGCRVGEIVSLEWDWIKGRRILLPDSKSGPRTVWLSGAARAVIDDIPRYGDGCPFVFPGRPPIRSIGNIGVQWDRIRREAGLSDVRLHDCRHTWASVAAMNGVDMVTVAKLLGHALVETTERYVHPHRRRAQRTLRQVISRKTAVVSTRPQIATIQISRASARFRGLLQRLILTVRSTP